MALLLSRLAARRLKTRSGRRPATPPQRLSAPHRVLAQTTYACSLDRERVWELLTEPSSPLYRGTDIPDPATAGDLDVVVDVAERGRRLEYTFVDRDGDGDRGVGLTLRGFDDASTGLTLAMWVDLPAGVSVVDVEVLQASLGRDLDRARSRHAAVLARY